MEQEDKILKPDQQYHFAKFDVRPSRPSYTDDQYESHLRDDEWDKAETDYLVDLAIEYDLRWVLIADRYDYQPAEMRPEMEDGMAIMIQPKPRSMEDMKARYYDVAAKTMALHHPLSSMSTSEFELHEKMTKFDPKVETMRKKIADGLQSRSIEEIQEEEILLGELKRIVTNHERFAQERKELYARLEAPMTTSSTAMYHSSDELLQLMKTLLSVDKNKKSRSLSEGNSTSGPPGSNLPNQNDRSQRHSISGPDKRHSLSGPSGQRHLSAADEAKFGVTHHDRLTAGVQFRHEKITKLSQAKSNVQATKISAALTELRIPPRLVMPTTKVVNEYERLIHKIHTLLDIRKVSEKTESEIKILKAQKEELERRQNGWAGDVEDAPGEDATRAEGKVEEEEQEEEQEDEQEDEEEAEEEDEEEENEDEEKEEDKNEEEEEDDDDDDDDDDEEEAPEEEAPEEEEKRPSTRGSAATVRKRSASIMSVVSSKSTKRQRK